MTASRPTFVVIDSYGGQLTSIGAAAKSLGDQVRVIARSRVDLFDDKRIKACAEEVRKADALLLILMGGIESVPGYADMLDAARGKPVHVHTGSEPPDFLEVIERYGLDFTSDTFRRRQAYLREGGVINLRNLLCLMGRDLGFDMPEPQPPAAVPTEGIYHPGYHGGAKDRDGYLAWARATQGRGADAPVIGIWFYRSSWLNDDVAVIDALIAEIEAQGAIALAVFNLRYRDVDIGSMSVGEVTEHFFKRDGEAIIDALLSPMGSSIAQASPGSGHVLPDLDVPVLQLILTYNPRADWEETIQAVTPMDVSTYAAQPEFDGVIIGTVVGTRDDAGVDPVTGARLARRTAVADRCRHVVKWARNWARLRRTPPQERKVVILFHQYPPRNDRLGCAVGLDSFESVKAILERLKTERYRVERDYPDGETLAFEMLDRLTSDRRYLPPKQMLERAVATIDRDTAQAWHDQRGPRMRKEMEEKWGEVPGVTFCYEGQILVGGVVNGNVFIGVQPPRARMEEGDAPQIQPDGKTIHDPYLPATHHYLGFYRWLRETFGAQVVYHVGKHGTLEWMPGKSLGLSRECYPDAAIADLPNLYPYIVNDPGEGTQAKRRSYCVILDHMIPPQTNAGKTDAFVKLEQLLDKAHIARQEDPAKVTLLLDEMWAVTAEAHLDADIGMTREQAEADPAAYIQALHGYIETVDVTSINDGLHIFGEPPQGERFNETLVHLTRLPCGETVSLWDAIAASRGLDAEDLRDHPGDYVPERCQTKGQALSEILADARAAFDELDARGWTAPALEEVAQARFAGSLKALDGLRFVADVARPKLNQVTDEIEYAARGTAGRFVPPGSSGAPTVGRLDVLPTGRNFYSLDPFKVPSQEAWKIGIAQAEVLIERYVKDEGRLPRQIGMVLWGSPTMRTHGNDLAEILYLMGTRPIWNTRSGRVTGVEVIPFDELKHPRIDVTVRSSGFFRDAFPNLMELLDQAVRMVAALREPEAMNPLAHNIALDRAELIKSGLSPEEADKRAAFRIYSDKPGAYGAGVCDLLDAGKWKTVDDLGDIYIHWGGYAYGQGVYGDARQDDFRKRMGRLDLTVKNEDSREYDMFSSDDFNSYHGGMNAAVKTASGKYARSYSGDASDPRKPRVRASEEEGRFVFRTRVINPKWIAGMKRHGYKGAGDLSRLVDICFQWDASSKILEDWQYEEMAKTYAYDPAMQEFFKKHNPYAIQNIVERLLEAISRGLWENPGDNKDRLEALLLEAEGSIEDSLAHGMKGTAG
jgi:cobaltochelatase CobN